MRFATVDTVNDVTKNTMIVVRKVMRTSLITTSSIWLKIPMTATAAGTKKIAILSSRKSAASEMHSILMTPPSINTSNSTIEQMLEGTSMGSTSLICSPARQTAIMSPSCKTMRQTLRTAATTVSATGRE